MLTTLPLRLNNIRDLQLGSSLIKGTDHYEVRLAGSETKNGRPYCAPLPPQLNKYVDTYLAEVRPRLLGSIANNSAWISYRYASLFSRTIYLSLRQITKDPFGIELNPHIFRDFAATYIAVHHPDKVRSVAAILGHSSFKTTQKHYNQANLLSAITQYQ